MKHTPPPWAGWDAGLTPAERANRQRRFMRRLSAFFIFAGLMVMVGLVGLVLLVLRAAGRLSIGPAEGVLLLCAVSIGVLVALVILAGLLFRAFGSPMAELMAAADSVAAGDLSVRVPARGHGQMAHFVRRFNRMTAELERAEAGRRRLTADVAHELRTPLHILQGNIEGLIDGVYQPTPEQLAAMLDETHLLARLVDDLQTLSLAEAGQLPLHRRPVPAADLLDDAVARFAPAAADAGITLKAAPDPAGLIIDVDPDRLDQALSNLVANALRHTPAGGWVMLAACPSQGGVELSVADTGPGIPADDLPHVFDRFWRGDPARGRAAGGGAGLGLSIARQLVEAHGGTLRVESEEGAGARFIIYLSQT
jgi:signal transduction histidine kinase